MVALVLVGVGVATAVITLRSGTNSVSPTIVAAPAPSLHSQFTPVAAASEPEHPREATPRALPFELFGTFAKTDPTSGQALLGATAQAAGLYHTSVEILPGTWLREVYLDRVVLDVNGVREVLTMSGATGGGAGSPRSALDAAAAVTGLPAVGQSDVIRMGAVPETDAVQGVRVFPGRNRGAFASMGLHPGELLTAVNGVPVNAASPPDLVGTLRDSGTATVTVFRAGRLQQITLRAPTDSNTPDP